jgi:hypothetical protein
MYSLVLDIPATATTYLNTVSYLTTPSTLSSRRVTVHPIAFAVSQRNTWEPRGSPIGKVWE